MKEKQEGKGKITRKKKLFGNGGKCKKGRKM